MDLSKVKVHKARANHSQTRDAVAHGSDIFTVVSDLIKELTCQRHFVSLRHKPCKWELGTFEKTRRKLNMQICLKIVQGLIFFIISI